MLRRHVSRLLWTALIFLGMTLVFWGLLQQHEEAFSNDLRSADLEIKRQLLLKQRLSRNFIPRAEDSGNYQHDQYHDESLEYHKNFKIKNPEPISTTLAHIHRNIATGKISYQPEPEIATRVHHPVPGGSSPALKKPKSNRIWPKRVEHEDRILNQMNLMPQNPNLEDKEEEKLIFYYNGIPSGISLGRSQFKKDECPVQNCRLTSNLQDFSKADAVVFTNGMYSTPPDRPPNQIWILYFLESPANVVDLDGNRNMFNWTATYRLDSTINTPYERFISYANATNKLPMPSKNYAAHKMKKVAWFVSNCFTMNGRMEYVKELNKFIEVDIFGGCGNKQCYRHEKERCNSILNRKYKFYLSFENSNCRDYITEKFYWNGLYNDIIPIVMGARKEDYVKVAPPNSYIHVDDFESPEQLAEYLHVLDKNDTLYNEYFRWKGTGEFINTKYWCRLCSMVHEAHNPASQHRFSMWYDNIQKWWNGPNTCINAPPESEDGVLWASWRHQLPDSVLSKNDPASEPDVLQFGSYA